MRKSGNLRLICGSAATALSVVLPATAFAQVEEIVVTAQRRSENMQDVPIAISAFGAEDIGAARIEEFQDIVGRIPSLSISTFSRGAASPALRGASVSSPSFSGGQSVGLAVDDVAYTTSADWELGLYDIERVEVLRGPQGTLFGRNVVGGVINIVTKMPDEEFGGTVEVNVGNYNRFDTKGSVNVPVGEGWATRLSFFTQKHDGTSFNRVTGNRLDASDKYGFRGLLQYRGEAFEFLLGAEYQRDISGGNARDYVGPSSAIPGYGFERDPDPRIVDQRIDGDFRMKAWSAFAKATYNGSFADFISITSYRKRDRFFSTDLLALPRSPLYFENDAGVRQFTQEFRAVSNDDGRLQWTAGLFYMNLELSEFNVDYFNYIPGTFLGDLQRCSRLGSASSPGCAAIFGLPVGDPSVPPNPAYVDNPIIYAAQRTREQSFAAYAQATLAVADALNLTLGARYTHEREKADIARYGDINFSMPEGPFSVSPKADWSAFTPKISIDYKLSPEHMVYATVAKGFKGGVLAAQDTAALSSIAIRPETAWNYEIGAKTEWLDRRLRVNLTGFKTDYTDQQTFLFGQDGQIVIENAGQVNVKGVELDVEASPVDNLKLWANYAYTKGRIRDLADLDGNRPGQLPPHALIYGASVAIPAPALKGEFTLRGEAIYKSKYYLNASNTPASETRYNHVVDASLNYRSDGGRISVSLWAKNLTDKKIVIHGQTGAALFYLNRTEPGASLAKAWRYADPRMYGISLRVSF